MTRPRPEGRPGGRLEGVDLRVKTFAAETASRLGFLSADYGFTGPDTVQDGDDDVYPVLRTLRYRRGQLTVEISLILSYMGEEYITATVVSAGETGAARRSPVGQSAAHSGYQMRRSLDRQAEAVRRLVRELSPPDHGSPE